MVTTCNVERLPVSTDYYSIRVVIIHMLNTHNKP